jgi:hypothetical protein
MDLDRRHVADAQQRVAIEIALLDAAFLERYFTAQCCRKREADRAFDLRTDVVRVDRRAAIHRANDAVNLD